MELPLCPPNSLVVTPPKIPNQTNYDEKTLQTMNSKLIELQHMMLIFGNEFNMKTSRELLFKAFLSLCKEISFCSLVIFPLINLPLHSKKICSPIYCFSHHKILNPNIHHNPVKNSYYSIQLSEIVYCF